MCAREGDHLVTPFQCDLCVFCNLQGRNTGRHDDMVMACIRQANLDACWGRETATVSSTLQAVQHTIQLLGPVGLQPPFPPLGPFPVADTFGYSMAIAMLLKSRQPGRYAAHQQFKTVHKLRAGYSNVFMALVLGQDSLRLMGGGTKQSNTYATARLTPFGLSVFRKVAYVIWAKLSGRIARCHWN
jgi:hypothetical protein